MPRKSGRTGRKKSQPLEKKIKSIVARTIHQAEPLHSRYVGSDAAAISSTWSVVDLSPVAQGDGFDQRVGDAIVARSIHFRGIVARETGASYIDYPRIMIVKWMPNSADEPLVAGTISGQILDSTWIFSIAQYVRDLVDRKKFKVIMDKSLVLGAPDPTFASDKAVVTQFNFVHRFKTAGRILYDRGATDGSGKYYLLFRGTHTVASGDNSYLSYTSQLRFDP